MLIPRSSCKKVEGRKRDCEQRARSTGRDQEVPQKYRQQACRKAPVTVKNVQIFREFYGIHLQL